jgi:hypothetical protein
VHGVKRSSPYDSGFTRVTGGSRVGDNADSSALGFRAFTSAATGAEDFFAMRVKWSDSFVPALN